MTFLFLPTTQLEERNIYIPVTILCSYYDRRTLPSQKFGDRAGPAVTKGRDCGNGWALGGFDCDVFEDLPLALSHSSSAVIGSGTASRALRGGVDA